MANTNINYTEKQSDLLPIPILELGLNYFLQHNRQSDFSTFINSDYSSSRYLGTITQNGNDWANDELKISISYPLGDYENFLNSTPMIFMEVLDQTGKSNYSGRYRKSQWVHPVNINGPINRSNTNYGGGDASTLITEWDLTSTDSFTETRVQINPKGLYYNTSTILPQRWVDFISSNGNQLRWQRSANLTPTSDGNNSRVVNTFVQPIRFRFAMLGEDGKSIILGNPSETLYISPKWGHFVPDDDTYVYDWQIRFHK